MSRTEKRQVEGGGIAGAADHAALLKEIGSLTPPQRAALGLFEPGLPRRAYPDVNPRCAIALWQKGVLQGSRESGKMYFLLSEKGVMMRQIVSTTGD